MILLFLSVLLFYNDSKHKQKVKDMITTQQHKKNAPGSVEHCNTYVSNTDPESKCLGHPHPHP